MLNTEAAFAEIAERRDDPWPERDDQSNMGMTRFAKALNTTPIFTIIPRTIYRQPNTEQRHADGTFTNFWGTLLGVLLSRKSRSLRIPRTLHSFSYEIGRLWRRHANAGLNLIRMGKSVVHEYYL